MHGGGLGAVPAFCRELGVVIAFWGLTWRGVGGRRSGVSQMGEWGNAVRERFIDECVKPVFSLLNFFFFAQLGGFFVCDNLITSRELYRVGKRINIRYLLVRL